MVRSRLLDASVLASTLVVAGTLAAAEASASPAATTTAPAEARPVFRPTTIDEFMKAIGPDRIIELPPGDYILSNAKRGVSPYFSWTQSVGEQYDLVIHNCNNLTIKSAGEKPAHLIMAFTYCAVLHFNQCDNIELINLKLGHAPEVPNCMGAVVEAAACAGLTISKCDLYGCGTQGLALRGVKHLKVSHTVIHDCTQTTAEMTQCEDLQFDNATFRHSPGGFLLTDCTQVAFVDCLIEDLEFDAGDDREYVFRTNLSDPDLAMTFKGGAIRNIKHAGLINTPGMLKLDNVKQENTPSQP